MEFLDRTQCERRPGGLTLLVNKRVKHEDFLAQLARPEGLFALEEIALDHEGKNRWGHGRLRAGLVEIDVHLKEFLPKSALDTVLSAGRASRAEKAFRAGIEMLRRGLPTPEPLAAVTRRRLGWVRRAWLVTELRTGLVPVRDLSDHPGRHASVLAVWPWPAILDALGRLLRRLTDAAVIHRDLSLRNVLVESPGSQPPAEPPLWIIDLNRVLTLAPGAIPLARAAANFERLRLAPEDFERVLAAHFPDPGEFAAHAGAFRAARRRHRLYKRIKKLPRGAR